jgi:hypothetical protein
VQMSRIVLDPFNKRIAQCIPVCSKHFENVIGDYQVLCIRLIPLIPVRSAFCR